MICYYVKSILIDTDHKYASRKLGTTFFVKLFSHHLIFFVMIIHCTVTRIYNNLDNEFLQDVLLATVHSGILNCKFKPTLFLISNSNKGSYKN